MPSSSSSLLGERRRFRRGGWGKRIRGVIDVPLLSFVGLGLTAASLSLLPPDTGGGRPPRRPVVAAPSSNAWYFVGGRSKPCYLLFSKSTSNL